MNEPDVIAPLLEPYLSRFPEPLESSAAEYFNSALNEGSSQGDCPGRRTVQIS